VLNLIQTRKTRSKKKDFFVRFTPLTLSSFSALIRNANKAGEKKEASFFLLRSSLFFCKVVGNVPHS
jgi:hypothetical protein